MIYALIFIALYVSISIFALLWMNREWDRNYKEHFRGMQ